MLMYTVLPAVVHSAVLFVLTLLVTVPRMVLHSAVHFCIVLHLTTYDYVLRAIIVLLVELLAKKYSAHVCLVALRARNHRLEPSSNQCTQGNAHLAHGMRPAAAAAAITKPS